MRCRKLLASGMQEGSYRLSMFSCLSAPAGITPLSVCTRKFAFISAVDTMDFLIYMAADAHLCCNILP